MILAAICEHGCSVGDGIAVAALAIAGAVCVVAFIWGTTKW